MEKMIQYKKCMNAVTASSLERRKNMYINAGYFTNEDIDIEDYTQPLLINSCGIYRLVHREVMSTTRPEGRNDYQLLYVASGKAYFHYTSNAQTEILTAPAGSMMLYRPRQMQFYEYFQKDNPEVCWVHFTGSEADSILDKIGFHDSPLLSCDTTGEYRELFRMIIQELHLKRPCFEEILPLYLRQLFALIMRSRLETSSEIYRPTPEITAAIQYFNESFSQNISIEEYAAGHHISACWFIRSFKRYTGLTPLQYITSIRINKAKELLQVSNYPIQEIANIVGYEDPLYFSRIFKKQTGHAPSKFQRGSGTGIV